MKAYVRAHTKALNEAKLAGELRAQGDLEGSDLHLRKALYLNAFGDHFLTDAFAAGHIRVPRRQLKSWGEDRLGGLFKKFKGDILSMALHDTEAKDPQGFEIGFPVKNSENLRWRTRSDSKLNECRQESHIGIRMPVEAVSQSVREVLLAYEEGSIPIGVFAAAALVPYADDSGLEAKVAALAGEEGLDHLAERLRDALPSVLKLIISEGDFRKMLTNMGSIMGLFRQDVARDLERDSKLSERLPRAYIDAYLNVN